MMILITYDVNTQDAAGRKRLRKVAKACINYGQRVQNSVFECLVDEAMFRHFQQTLKELIDLEKDSLRFYHIGDNYRHKIQHIGAKPSYDPEGLLIV